MKMGDQQIFQLNMVFGNFNSLSEARELKQKIQDVTGLDIVIQAIIVDNYTGS